MMKLRYSITSPFVRKVLVTAIETGQENEIERVKTNTADPELAACNPLNKIPALTLEDGSVLIDSAVICEFLDHRKGAKLFPRNSTRWPVLSLMALCDGMMDAAILRRYETLRPEALRSSEWDQRQKGKVWNSLAELERQAPGFGDRVDIGTLTAAIMLDYLDFRFAHEPWRDAHPKLAQWHKAFSARPSLQATLPAD
ncbi:glutathione S-transferase [Dongia sedimenti]|uniref:Glutathione S-transferase n=1 Tax=Dongia sedimenti TaxID=3064282 RepID=A0ABU0YQ43_9PROT|nr:glutathione S-transferase [Rhodospirillaceae bacterium R-7]